MQKFLSLIISGTVTGGIYSIMASGLVLTYTTSGIFNFAQGAIAFAVAYFYYQLNTGGMPIVPAAILSILVFAPLMGFALDRLLLRRLGEAPVYARIVGTIGLLVAIPNFMEWVVVTIGNNIFHMGWVGNKASNQGLLTPGLGPTPPKVFHVMEHVALTSDQLAVFVAALVAALALWIVLRHTRIGLEMRAVVDRRHLAGLKGVSAGRTSAVAWVLTTVLAGLGGILISPLFILDPIVFTLVVLGSLAAVVLGGLRSIPIAFVGGVLLGMVQNLVAGYSTAYPGFIANLNGLSSAVPYVLVILLGLVVGRDRSRQAGSVAEDRPPSDHRAGMSAARRWWPWLTFLFLLVGYSLHWFPSWFQATATAQTAIAQGLAISIILLSFIVVTGMGGMVSLAQATFVTAGGFAAGWALNHNWGVNLPLVASHGQLNFFWAVVIGAIVAGVIGALIAWPATPARRRLPGHLVVGRLPVLQSGALRHPGHRERPVGLEHPEPGPRPLRMAAQLRQPQRPDPPVRGSLRADHRGHLAVHPLRRPAGPPSPSGARRPRRWPPASGPTATGSSSSPWRQGSPGSAGSCSACSRSPPPTRRPRRWTGSPGWPSWWSSGCGDRAAPCWPDWPWPLGRPLLNQVTNWLPGQTFNTLISSPYFLPILFGMGAISLAQEPDGILAMRGSKKLARRRARAKRAEAGPAAPTGAPRRPTRRARGSRFVRARGPPDHPPGVPGRRPGRPGSGGGLRRRRGAPRDRARAAGRGDRRPARRQRCGKVLALRGDRRSARSRRRASSSLGGTDLTTLPAFRRARAGLDLVPEARGIFPGLTVEENLSLALPDEADRKRAYARFPVLAERRLQVAGLLSGGEQQMLSLAPALARPPKVFIADEPTLGLAPLAAEVVIRAIVELRDKGTAVLLVEENAENAVAVADRLIFMELGTITWAGPASSLDVDQLSAVYLGGGQPAPVGVADARTGVPVGPAPEGPPDAP